MGFKQQQQIIGESTPVLVDRIQEVFNILLHGLVYIREVIESAFEPQNAEGCVNNS